MRKFADGLIDRDPKTGKVKFSDLMNEADIDVSRDPSEQERAIFDGKLQVLTEQLLRSMPGLDFNGTVGFNFGTHMLFDAYRANGDSATDAETKAMGFEKKVKDIVIANFAPSRGAGI